MKKQSTKQRLDRWRREEQAKLAPMTRKERLEYIAEYYWLLILGVVGGIVLLGYIVYRANFTVKDYWFYAIYANTNAEAGSGSELWSDFRDYGSYDTKQKKLMMNSASYFDPSITGGTNNSYFQSFVALVESGDLDIITMGRAGIEALGTSGRLMDLSSEDGKEIGEKYADRLVYALPYDTEYSETEIPIGIDVSDSLLVNKYGLYEEDCVLAVSAYTKRPEEVKQFLAFIFGETADFSESRTADAAGNTTAS
ncbi:MAG: hypothetical protein Q4B09_02070, partial [Lachnospiraceae bacterium]|nr:hypothetical protein [Lachnospiraceae bacterium]